MTSLITILGADGSRHCEMLGSKFDHFFRYHDGEKTEVASCGDQEEYVHGYAYLREVTEEAISNAPEHAWHDGQRLDPGWYIDVRDSNGFIFAFSYLGDGTMAEEDARGAYAEYENKYNDWLAAQEDDPDESNIDSQGHVNYPHWPGYLIGCPACDDSCHCEPDSGNAQCVWSGHNE